MAELPKYFYYVPKVDGLTITVEDRSDRDVVEVVRCKDCKYSVFEQWVDAMDVYTCNRTSLTRACGDCSPADFCSWAKRKDEVKE